MKKIVAIIIAIMIVPMMLFSEEQDQSEPLCSTEMANTFIRYAYQKGEGEYIERLLTPWHPSEGSYKRISFSDLINQCYEGQGDEKNCSELAHYINGMIFDAYLTSTDKRISDLDYCWDKLKVTLSNKEVIERFRRISGGIRKHYPVSINLSPIQHALLIRMLA